MVKDIAVTPEQLEVMKHSIGLDRKAVVRKGTYQAYRNFFCAGTEDTRFELLCGMGLCGRSESHGSRATYYYVTKDGAAVIQAYTGINIVLEG